MQRYNSFCVKHMLSSILDFTYVFPQNAQLWLDQVEVQLQTALFLQFKGHNNASEDIESNLAL